MIWNGIYANDLTTLQARHDALFEWAKVNHPDIMEGATSLFNWFTSLDGTMFFIPFTEDNASYQIIKDQLTEQELQYSGTLDSSDPDWFQT